MEKFNWDEFKNKDNKIAVHCETEEEAKDFCRQMHGQGMKWRNGESYLKDTSYNARYEGTCYYGDGEWPSLDFAEKHNLTVEEMRKKLEELTGEEIEVTA